LNISYLKKMLRILEEEVSTESLVMGILGSIISVGLNLTPIVLFYQYFKKERLLKEIPEMMFVSGVFCSSTNLAFGIILNDKILITSNTICETLQILYSTIFLFLYSNKNISKFLLYLIIAYDLTFEVIFIFANVIEFHAGHDAAENFTGAFNSIIGVVNVIAPGQNIIKVFKTEDFTLIPIVTIIFQCLCSTFWGVYGIIQGNIWMILPNLIGTTLTIIQMGTYLLFYCKRGGVPPKKKENSQIKEEREDEDEENNNKKEDEENQQNLIDK